MPKLGLKHCFLGLGGQFKAPQPFFAGAGFKEEIPCMLWKPENSRFRATPPKNGHFLGQKWPKIANFGQKSSVLGLGCSGQGPPILFLRSLTPKNMYCMALKLENGFFRAANPKNGHFLPKSGQKMSILGLKHYFWAWEVSSSPRNPVLQLLGSKEHQLHGMEAGK